MEYKLYRVKADGKYFAFSSIMARPIWLNGPQLAAHWPSPRTPVEIVSELGKGEVEECDKFGAPDGRKWAP
jgi:hypothetical protein